MPAVYLYTLMEHDLVDETSHKKPMRLLETRTVGDSLVYIAYERG